MHTCQEKKLHFGYVVAAGLIILMIPECFPMNTASIFYTPVSRELQIPVDTFGFHMTLLTMSMALSVPLIERIFDRIDSRLFLTVVVAVEAAMFFINSTARSVSVFYGTSIVLGFVMSVYLYFALPMLMNRWFAVRSVFMIGLCGAAQGLWGMVFNTLGGIIIDGIGWRGCYRIWALVSLAAGLPAALLLISDSPAKKGLTPVGWERRPNPAEKTITAITNEQAKAIKRSRPYILMTLFEGILALSMTINFYMGDYIRSKGGSTVMTGIAASAVMLGTMLGKIIVGYVSDKHLKTGLLLALIPAIISVPML